MADDFNPLRALLQLRDDLRGAEDDHFDFTSERELLAQLIEWYANGGRPPAIEAPPASALSRDDLEALVAARHAFAYLVNNETSARGFTEHVEVLNRIINARLGIEVLDSTD